MVEVTIAQLSKQDRQERILGQLNNDITVRISTLAEYFNVSTETIRRDIDSLTEKGKVKRTYGGAASVSLTSEPGINQRGRTNIHERERIASYAISLVDPGDVLMIDSGSTTAHFARALTTRPMKLTVLTNCFPVAQILGNISLFHVVVCPGAYNASENGVYGHETTAFLNRFHANKTFISAGGITKSDVTEADVNASWIKRKMIQRSEQVLLLLDNGKFDKPLFDKVCSWSEISDLIVDEKPSESMHRRLQKFQVNIHIAK